MKLCLTLVIALAAGRAFGAASAFDNHLKSAPMVSPAQIYQTQDLTTDFALGFTSEATASKPDAGDKTTADTSGTDLFAAGIYNFKEIGLRAGLLAEFGTANIEVKRGAAKGKSDASLFVASPTVAMPLGPVVIGAAVDLIQATSRVEGSKEEKFTRNDFRPGVLFAQDNFEAGITYTSKSTSNQPDLGAGVKDDAQRIPAQTTVHGRYAVDKTMAFGAIAANVRESTIGDDVFKDQQRFKVTGEFALAAAKIEGDVGYNTAYYKRDANVTEDDIATVELGAAADYDVTKTAAIGGGLGYEFGSGKNAAAKREVSADKLSVLVRGGMKF